MRADPEAIKAEKSKSRRRSEEMRSEAKKPKNAAQMKEVEVK